MASDLQKGPCFINQFLIQYFKNKGFKLSSNFENVEPLVLISILIANKSDHQNSYLPKVLIALGIITLLGTAIASWLAYAPIGYWAFAVTGGGVILGGALITIGACLSLKKEVEILPEEKVEPPTPVPVGEGAPVQGETLAVQRQKFIIANKGKIVKSIKGDQDTALVHYSFINSNPAYRAVKAEILEKIRLGTLSSRENRYLGVMLGMACGDAVGAPFEFLPHLQILPYLQSLPKDFNEYVEHFLPAGSKGYLESEETFDMTTKGLAGVKMKMKSILNGGKFELKPGQWSDDTAMGLCLGDVLIVDRILNDAQLMEAFLDWWDHGYNNAFTGDEPRTSVGLGSNIAQSLAAARKDPELGPNATGAYATKAGNQYTSGNGGLMRLGPVALVAKSEGKARELAAQQSRVTHQGVEAAACAELMASLIFQALHHDPQDNPQAVKAAVFKELENFKCDVVSVNALAHSQQDAKSSKDNISLENWNWRDENFAFNEERLKTDRLGYIGSYAMDALAMALHCVWTTNSFREAVIKAATRGGDADSVGAIVGQIAGAIYGFTDIPENWIKSVQQWDGEGDIAARAALLLQLQGANS